MGCRGTLTFGSGSTFNHSGTLQILGGNPIHVSLLYTGGVLRATFVESNTPNTFTTNLAVNIPAIVGAETAYVGFTGADGGVASTQVVSNFTFVPLTAVLAERTAPDELTLSWPQSIGGYTTQTRSSLAPPSEAWTFLTNSAIHVNGRNKVIISPLPGSQYYRLFISLPD